jgi:hypothetical protein
MRWVPGPAGFGLNFFQKGLRHPCNFRLIVPEPVFGSIGLQFFSCVDVPASPCVFVIVARHFSGSDSRVFSADRAATGELAMKWSDAVSRVVAGPA